MVHYNDSLWVFGGSADGTLPNALYRYGTALLARVYSCNSLLASTGMTAPFLARVYWSCWSMRDPCGEAVVLYQICYTLSL